MIRVYRNTATRRRGTYVLRHRGTCQRIIWCGPIVIALSNRRAVRARRR